MAKTDLIVQGKEKLQGYNQGFEEATSNFSDIILVLFISQVIQVITYRLLSRQNPFSIAITNPKTGKELKSWGSEKQLTPRQIRIIEIINNNMFSLGLALATYLYVVNNVPAYNFWVM